MAVINGEVECVLYRISTSKIINANYMVNENYLPPQGLDPDLKVYAKLEPFPPSEIDVRLYAIETTRVLSETPHPDFPQVGQYIITHEEVSRTNDAIISSLDICRVNANNQIDNGHRLDKMLQKAIPILVKRDNDPNYVLTPLEQFVITTLSNVAAKKQLNDNLYGLKRTSIENNQPVDLDDGWVTT